MARIAGLVVCLLAVFAVASKAQESQMGYGRRNTLGVMAEYSNDSSHIILGAAERVKLGALGVQYQRRLIANRRLIFSYAAEFRPLMIQSNLTETSTFVQTFPTYLRYSSGVQLATRCTASAVPYHVTQRDPPVQYSGAEFTTCGRQANYSLGLAPFGMRLNFRPRARLQPTLSTFEGMILSTKPLPISSAGSFNFAFEVGGGMEFYRTDRTSVRLEFQVQHYSNDYTASTNPGVDNGMLKLTYNFGR